MNYIDNNSLFNELPNNNRTPKGMKVLLALVGILAVGATALGISSHLKIAQKQNETDNKTG